MRTTSPCISKKKRYATLELAEDALIETRTRFEFSANNGPIAVYQCEDCGDFHLTSKGVMNARLAKELSDGKIKLNKEADRWRDKFKRY